MNKKIDKIPNHIAIIPDGNRRWAKQHGLPTIEGHRRGAIRFKELAKAARSYGIHTLTAWGFSTENWGRDPSEVSYLMDLFIWLIKENEKDAHQDKVRVRHLGRKDRLPEKLLKEIERVENNTAKYDQFNFNLCIDYGGQDEIIRAVNKILNNKISEIEKNREIIKKIQKNEKLLEDQQSLTDKNAGNINVLKLTIDEFYNYLDTSGQKYPNPDLLIRTSGDMRTSGLMPFQMVYTEFYFEQSYLPDFTVEKLDAALGSFAARDRRFGGNSTGKLV